MVNRKVLLILGANIASLWIVIGLAGAAWLDRSRNDLAHSRQDGTHVVAPVAMRQDDPDAPVGNPLRATARLWRESRDPHGVRRPLLLTNERLEADSGLALEAAPSPPVVPPPASEPSVPASQGDSAARAVLEEDRGQITITISADRPTRSKDPTPGRLDRRWEDYQATLRQIRASMQLAGDREWPMKPWTVAGGVGKLSAMSPGG